MVKIRLFHRISVFNTQDDRRKRNMSYVVKTKIHVLQLLNV